MKQRLLAIRRIQSVRTLEERMREAALLRARAELLASQQALAKVTSALCEAQEHGRAALVVGDRGAAVLAHAMREVADWQRAHLEAQCGKRSEQVAATQASYATSRMQRECCEAVGNDVAIVWGEEQRRSEQAASDDRFAARRHGTTSMKLR